MNYKDMISMACPGCKKRLRVKAVLAGKTVRCPNTACGVSIVVDVPTATPASAPASWKRTLWLSLAVGGILLFAVLLSLTLLLMYTFGSGKPTTDEFEQLCYKKTPEQLEAALGKPDSIEHRSYQILYEKSDGEEGVRWRKTDRWFIDEKGVVRPRAGNTAGGEPPPREHFQVRTEEIEIWTYKRAAVSIKIMRSVVDARIRIGRIFDDEKKAFSVEFPPSQQ